MASRPFWQMVELCTIDVDEFGMAAVPGQRGNQDGRSPQFLGHNRLNETSSYLGLADIVMFRVQSVAVASSQCVNLRYRGCGGKSALTDSATTLTRLF